MGLTALSHLQPVDNTNRDLYDYEVLTVEHLQQGYPYFFTSAPNICWPHEYFVEKYGEDLPVLSNLYTGLDRPLGLQEVGTPRISRQPYAPAIFTTPQEISLVLIYVRG